MAIYSRDNLQLQGALDAALRNRQAYRDRQDARLRNSINSVGRALPVFGRSIEMALEDTDPRMEKDPAYRSARFDYEFTGDRSGLDSIASRLQQAKEAQLNRQSNEKIAGEAKARSAEEDEATWRKNMALSSSTLRDVRAKLGRGEATQKDLEDAIADHNYYVERGKSKNYANVPSFATVDAPKLENATPEPTLASMAKGVKESVAQIVAQDSASEDDINKALAGAEFLKGQGADMSDEIAKLNDKKQKIAEKGVSDDWENARGNAESVLKTSGLTIQQLDDLKTNLDSVVPPEGKQGDKDKLLTDISNKRKALVKAEEAEKENSRIGKWASEDKQQQISMKNALGDKASITYNIEDPQTGKTVPVTLRRLPDNKGISYRIGTTTYKIKTDDFPEF